MPLRALWRSRWDFRERPQVSGWNESRKRSVRAVPREARSNEQKSPATEQASRGILSPPCILKGTALYCYVFGNYIFSLFLVYNYKAENSAILLLRKRTDQMVQKR